MLYFLADRWQHQFAEDSDVGRARECMLAVVAASTRGGPNHGASVNAATLLNWMCEPMVGQAWQGVHLSGADLTRAILCRTSLAGARLAGCRLEKAVLRDVDLRGTDMVDVEFGEVAPLLGHGAGVVYVAMDKWPPCSCQRQ